MKATDLMVGDWVLCSGRKKRITEIHEENVHTSGWAFYYSDLKPIQLTKEILKKSGFESDGSIVWNGEILSTFIISDTIDGYLSDEGKLEISFLGKYTFCTVSALHELQHALKLCGIDKDIQL